MRLATWLSDYPYRMKNYLFPTGALSIWILYKNGLTTFLNKTLALRFFPFYELTHDSQL